MSHEFKIECVVKKPDGSGFYAESHSWSDIDEDGLNMLVGELQAFKAKVQGEMGRGDDSSNFSASFVATLDGVEDPENSFVVAGVSYKSVSKLEREWLHVQDRVVKEGEKRAKSKK